MSFRGGKTCLCVITSLPWMELDLQRRGLFRNGELFRVFQWGYRDDVDASAGTHNGGGNIDTRPYSSKVLAVTREWGWTLQDRSPFFEQDHWHGSPYGCPHLSPAGEKQITGGCGWNNKKNGLANCGPVQGPYPVKRWDIAFKENVVSLLGDIKKEIAAEVVKELKDSGYAHDIWNSVAVDVFKPPPGDRSTTNPHWKPQSEIEWLVESVADIKKALKLP